MAKRRKPSANGLPAVGRLRDIADQLWSRAVRDDWGNRCAVCGSRNKVEAHHLVPRQHTSTRHDVQNGISLCSWCHKFDPHNAPHQHAAGWMAWLNKHHPRVAAWYEVNRNPQFGGKKNADYYLGRIRELRQYVEPEDFERIVGVRLVARIDGEDE